jgi:3-hydroxybutyrate dehydrogenase
VTSELKPRSSGRVAVVTGGASGIGRAIAERLFADGASVVIADIDPAGGPGAAAALGPATFVRADLTIASDRDRLVETALASHGRIDILVNNAGIQHVAPLEDFPPDRWEYLIALHLVAPAMLIRAVLPGMYERGWGRIINIGSINSLIAQPNKSAYVAAKHGLLGLTKAVALEAGPHGVTVNAVCPAFVRTPLVERQIGDLARTEGIPLDDVVSRVMLDPSAIKRLIEPAEVAAMVGFLCSDDAAAITGAANVIDGGWTAR